MIVDRLENLQVYESIAPGMKDVLSFIHQQDLSTFKEAKKVLSDNAYVMYQEKTTKDPSRQYRPEIHQNYIDIQLVLEGDEVIMVSNQEYGELVTPYNPEKDIAFYHFTKHYSQAVLEPMEFALLFPWELHAPCIRYKSETEKKLVFKVKWDKYK